MFEPVSLLFTTERATFSLPDFTEQNPVISATATHHEFIDEATNIEQILFDAVFNHCNLATSRDLAKVHTPARSLHNGHTTTESRHLWIKY
ncbi:hypothetical protein ACL7TT_16790 [Microbulbifer sp. 2304DJ12-6]|uniref:hypothetical protein n=1 Tax=Microbulbifer sp. 2304DJ12-6 TaxID=3233340 RepID=UPI0039AF78BB